MKKEKENIYYHVLKHSKTLFDLSQLLIRYEGTDHTNFVETVRQYKLLSHKMMTLFNEANFSEEDCEAIHNLIIKNFGSTNHVPELKILFMVDKILGFNNRGEDLSSMTELRYLLEVDSGIQSLICAKSLCERRSSKYKQFLRGFKYSLLFLYPETEAIIMNNMMNIPDEYYLLHQEYVKEHGINESTVYQLQNGLLGDKIKNIIDMLIKMDNRAYSNNMDQEAFINIMAYFKSAINIICKDLLNDIEKYFNEQVLKHQQSFDSLAIKLISDEIIKAKNNNNGYGINSNEDK